MFMLDNKPLPLDTGFTHNGTSYPANWLRLNSIEERNAIGITEVADPEAYDDAEMFDKAYNEIKQQFGSVTIEGQPNITFSLEGEDIKMNYTVEY